MVNNTYNRKGCNQVIYSTYSRKGCSQCWRPGRVGRVPPHPHSSPCCSQGWAPSGRTPSSSSSAPAPSNSLEDFVVSEIAAKGLCRSKKVTKQDTAEEKIVAKIGLGKRNNSYKRSTPCPCCASVPVWVALPRSTPCTGCVLVYL